MSTIKVDTIQTTGGVEVYTAKAWVNFLGTGTVAVNNSGNVSSITDVGVGRYTSNFASALSAATYATSFDNTSYATNNSSVNIALEGSSAGGVVSLKTTSAVRCASANPTANYDTVNNSVLVFL